MTDITSDLDTAITEEELAAYSVMRQAFAANFFRRQIAKYEQHLGSSAIAAFTRWWNSRVDSFRLFTESQREFDGQAFDACDRWLERWVKQQAKAIATGKIETSPSPDQEVSRIRASWGISNSDAKNISKVIRQGVKKFVPALRNKSAMYTGKSLLFPTVISPGESDAVQDAWVALLTKSESGTTKGAAYSAGGSAGRKIVRKDARFIPISQLQSANLETEVTLDDVQKIATDEDYQKSNESKVETILGEARDAIRRAILSQFCHDTPEDYDFIVDYLKRVDRDVVLRHGRRVSVSKRGAKTTPEERKRAHDIMKKLRKWEISELQN